MLDSEWPSWYANIPNLGRAKYGILKPSSGKVNVFNNGICYMAELLGPRVFIHRIATECYTFVTGSMAQQLESFCSVGTPHLKKVMLVGLRFLKLQSA